MILKPLWVFLLAGRNALTRAEAGDAKAQYKYGGAMMLIRQRETAVTWLTAAAEQDYRNAMFVLARLLRRMHRDDEALFWYTRASEAGHPSAAYAAGVKLAERGDLVAAREQMVRAIELGHPTAKLLPANVLVATAVRRHERRQPKVSGALRPSRVQSRTLETPIYTFTHPGTKRTVHVIATVHVGRRSYYTELKAFIRARQHSGAEVHCEGSGLGELLINPPPDLTAEEKELLDTAIEAETTKVTRTPEPGWTHQSLVFGEVRQGRARELPESWQRKDMPYLEYARAIGVDVLHRELQEILNPSESMRKLMGSRHLAALGFYGFIRSGRLAQSTDEVTMRRREEIALQGIDDTDADVVLTWGAAHVPGLTKGLVTRGFVLSGESWRAVGRLPGKTACLIAIVPKIPACYRVIRDKARTEKALRRDGQESYRR